MAMMGVSLFQERLNGCNQVCFGHHAACPPKCLASVEQHQCGYGLYAVLAGCCAVLVYIYFDDADAVAQCGLHLFQYWVHHLAWLTPCGEKVYQYGLPAIDYIVEGFHNMSWFGLCCFHPFVGYRLQM